jgi:hypothetical protein
MGLGLNLGDAAQKQTAALPNGAAATQVTGFDLMNSVRGDFMADVQLQVDVPATTTGELADTQTITLTVESDDNAAFSSPLVIATLGTITGAGGVGAAAVTYYYRLPVNVERYVRVKATKAGASNASTKSMTAALKF